MCGKVVKVALHQTHVDLEVEYEIITRNENSDYVSQKCWLAIVFPQVNEQYDNLESMFTYLATSSFGKNYAVPSGDGVLYTTGERPEPISV